MDGRIFRDEKNVRRDVTFFVRNGHIGDMGQEEFKQQVVPLRPRLLGHAERLLACPAEAEDVVQEVLLRLWTMRGQLDRYRSVAALSLTMIKNLCLNRLGTLKRKAGPPAEQIPADGVSPYRSLENRDNLDRTLRIIDALPPVQRGILRMRHLDGLEIGEIAALSGSTPEAVRVNLSRARKRVRELFMKEEGR
jgi:RNA polymerase sigma-70 factor (ECF subfamily)